MEQIKFGGSCPHCGKPLITCLGKCREVKTEQPTGGTKEYIQKIIELISQSNNTVMSLHQMDKSGDHPLFDKRAIHLRVQSDLDFINKKLAEAMRLAEEIPLPTQSTNIDMRSEEDVQKIVESEAICDGEREEKIAFHFLRLGYQQCLKDNPSGLNKEEIIKRIDAKINDIPNLQKQALEKGNPDGFAILQGELSGMIEIKAFILSIPSTQENMETKIEWISVKDKLPTDKKTYTCYGEDWAGYPIFSAIYDEQGWYIMNGDKRMRQFPTHWKPIQSPHKTQ